jgi:hypothetical protein
MMNKRVVGSIVLVLLPGCPSLAFAYIGPGLGAGAVGAVLAILASVLMLVVGVLWYPLKRLIKFLRRKKP